MKWPNAGRLWLLGVCLAASAWFPARAARAGASVEEADCKECGNKGSQRCPTCKGRGESNKAKLQCPTCKGLRKQVCEKCSDQGLVKCKKCKKRKIEGIKVYAVRSSQWKKWNKKYGKKAGQFYSKEAMRKAGIPTPPEKYAVCPDCKGEGKVTCNVCKGTLKINCPRCKGAGTVLGKGPCPTCAGKKLVVCKTCGELEGLEKLKAHKTLQALFGEDVLTPEEYFKRRRDLVATEKRNRKRLAGEERKRAAAEKLAAEARARAEAEAGKKEAGLKKKKEVLALLIRGFAVQALTASMYEAKVREKVDLPLKVIRRMEADFARTEPRMKKLLKLKKDLSGGAINEAQYKKAIEKL